MRAPPILLAVLLVTSTALVLPGAVAQDDAGSGADAPDSCDQARDVALGSFSGTLNESDDDHEDWYRVEVPDDKMLVVEVTPDDGDTFLYVDTRDDACDWTDDEEDFDYPGVTVAADTQGSDAIRFVVETFSDGAVDYTVETALYDVPDPTITDIEVEKEPVRTDVAAAPTGTQRTVHVTVENAASGDFPDGFTEFLGVEVEHDNGEERDLGYEGFDPFETEAQTLSFEWDGNGEAGDVTVEADFWFDVDQNEANNQESESSYVLVGGIGVGVDTLNRDDEVRVGDTEAEYDSEYDYWSRSVGTRASGPSARVGPLYLSTVYAQAYVADHDYGTDAFAYADAPAAFAFLYADEDGDLYGNACAVGAGCVGLP